MDNKANMESTKSEEKDRGGSDMFGERSDLLYGIDETPPWYLIILLGFQQFLMSVTSFLPNPIIISVSLCLADDLVGMGEFIGSVFFVGGVASLIQTTFGVRLPIVQGPSATFVAPIIMLMKTNTDICPDFTSNNTTLPFEAGSDEHRAVWKGNMRELQGALIVASVVELLLGLSGAIGFLMRYIGPLTTGTVITLIGLSLTSAAAHNGSQHWWICFLTIFFIILFSQYLKDVSFPFFGSRLKFFLLFPILLAVGISWIICFILTVTNVLPNEKESWGYRARTDVKWDAVEGTQWFRFPYPGQYGRPTLSAGSVVAMLAAVLASTIESVGDYYACARLCEVPKPPASAISRGIGLEGFCCILAGACGTGLGFTSYSSNIATLGLTKVCSRVVVQFAALMLILAGCIGKIGAFFSTVPEPIVGAMIYAVFGMVSAVGVSNLATVNLNSTRNLFVFGFSVFFALSVPKWVDENPFDLGSDTANQALTVFCSTSMLVGGVIAFILDNTLAGTLEDRGIKHKDNSSEVPIHTGLSAYNIPWIQSWLDGIKWMRWVPICPGFDDASKLNESKTSPDSIELEVTEVQINGGVTNDGYVSEKL